MQTKKYIILYASTCSVDENIKSLEEYKAIHEAVNNYDHIELLDHLEDVTPVLLHEELRKVIADKPIGSKIIFQLAGHGDRTGFFIPEGFDQESQLTVTPATIRKYFEEYADHIECIIFSSCSSVKLAESVFAIEKLMCSIGTNIDLDSNLSIGFTSNFYQQFRATNHDFEAALNHAKTGLILHSPAELFWGKSKQESLWNSLIAEKSQITHLKTIRELQKHLSDVLKFGKTKDININLYHQIKSSIHSINKAKKFTSAFGDILEISFNNPLKSSDKIQIFALQKKFVFEYALMLTGEISQLLKEGAIKEIPIVLQDLIQEYHLNHLDFKFDEIVGVAEKIHFLKQKRREIDDAITQMQNQEIKEATMYIKIYELIKVLTENQTTEMVEVFIKTESVFDERVKKLSQPFAKLREGYDEYKDSVIKIIPNHLLQ